jgi:hypothetical protein
MALSSVSQSKFLKDVNRFCAMVRHFTKERAGLGLEGVLEPIPHDPKEQV